MAAKRGCLKWTRTLLLLTLTLGLPWSAYGQSTSRIEERLRQGETLVSEGRWDEAIKELTAVAQLDPKRADAYASLGTAYYFKGDAAAAALAFRAALQLSPSRIDAAHGLGLALSETRDLDGALAAFRTASQLNPIANYNLGNILEQRGDKAGALEAYKRYLAAAPAAPDAAALNAAVQKATLPTPAGGTAKDHFQRGQALLDRKDGKGAQAEFLAALRLKPNYVEACNALGLAFRATGDMEQAIGGYQMAIHLDPKFGVAYRNLAQAFEETGDLPKAAQFYDQYLLVAPGAADAAQVRDKIAQLRASLR
jgi:tetratricopeptide (TPR) repeat protein